MDVLKLDTIVKLGPDNPQLGVVHIIPKWNLIRNNILITLEKTGFIYPIDPDGKCMTNSILNIF